MLYCACAQVGKGIATNDSDRTTAVDNHDPSNGGSSDEPEFVVPEVLPVDEGNPKHKIKGAAQVAAGAALTAAGVPMLVLPGAAAIAGGAALISKGQRNYSGRAATPFEEKLDDAAEKAAVAVKVSAEKTAHKAAEEAPKAAKKVVCEAPLVAEAAARAAKPVVKGVAGAAVQVAKPVAKSVAGAAVAAGGQLARKGFKYLENKKSGKKSTR